MMHLAFAINNKNKDWLTKCISLLTRAAIYHCEFRFSDGISCSTNAGKGVHLLKRNYDFYEWLLIPLKEVSNEKESYIRYECERLANSGAKYDYIGAVFGGIFGWNDSNKYFCSELCANLLYPLYNLHYDTWYSPSMLWKDISEYLSKKDVYQPYI